MTAKRQALLDLAARVKGLDGPSREVDALIWAEVVHGGYSWVENRLRLPNGMRIGVIDPGEIERNFTCWHPNVPAYTVSLDSAMQLVPPDDSFTVGQNVHHKHWQASVNYVNESGEPQSRGCSNATKSAALALTAAALRARAMMEPQDE